MAVDFPNDPSPGATFTANSKTWTFTDGKWALNVSVGGVRGPAGVAIQETAPTTTDTLWVDTSDTGLVIVPAGGTTGQVLAKSSSASYDTAWATPVTSSDLALKANLASPTFSGTPTLPTGTIATTQTAGNNTTAVATTAFVSTAVANIVDSAPATLNTLDELAAALGDDANFATTTATAIGLKAPLANPTFTGTVAGVTKSMVGLGNVDNTADTAKPVSTAQQTALDLKANIASPALTGTPTAPTAGAGTNTTQLATTAFANQAGGLVLISNTAVGSGVSSVTVNGCFSSTYDTYKIIYTGGTCSNAGTQTNVRLGATTAGYATNLVYQVWGSGTVLGATNTTSAWFWIGGEKRGVAGGPCVMSFELTNPFASTYTMMNSNMYGADTTGGTTVGRLDNTASYTSVTLMCEVGTFSGGNVYVYGYRK